MHEFQRKINWGGCCPTITIDSNSTLLYLLHNNLNSSPWVKLAHHNPLHHVLQSLLVRTLRHRCLPSNRLPNNLYRRLEVVRREKGEERREKGGGGERGEGFDNVKVKRKMANGNTFEKSKRQPDTLPPKRERNELLIKPWLGW